MKHIGSHAVKKSPPPGGGGTGSVAPDAARAPVPPKIEAALRFFSRRQDSAWDPDTALDAYIALFDALRPRRSEGVDMAAARYQVMVERLESDRELATALRTALHSLLMTKRLQRFFSDSGILPATGFFSELFRIFSHRLLPELPDPDDFQGCIQRLLHKPGDWIWLSAVPPELGLRFWRALASNAGDGLEPTLLHIADQMVDALLVLAYRIASLGDEAEMSRLGPRFVRHVVRFQATASAAQRFAEGLRRAMAERRAPDEDGKELLVLLDQCREALDEVHRIALRQGTSLRLTYQLRRSRQTLRRIEMLVQLLDSHGTDEHALLETWSTLFREALRMENQRNSPGPHLTQGLEMLALRVTDNAAKTGEHYVAETRPQYWGMWRAAAGAGGVIAGLALLKLLTAKLALAPAGYALLYSLNYGLGFVLIYMLHLVIATKQPAMTAQTLAGYLDRASQGKGDQLDSVVDLIVAVWRSQLAAIFGNVLVALPTALVIAQALAEVRGVAVIDPAKARLLLADLDPFGWAIPHAAIAGVFLFLSGMISGYFDNLASYARVGARVARLRWLRASVGTRRAARVGDYFDNHLGGLMGNFLFGCMLGSAGTIGLILGLPIDIRHIAFSSANLGYALQALDYQLPWGELAWAVLGVGLIGFTNLTVSFSLALWMALKARGVTFTRTRALLGRLGARIRTQPRSFLWPATGAEGDARTPG
jgi:site-specific recombinase